MRTWSLAGLVDKFMTLERITRPPRMGHDVDVQIGNGKDDVDNPWYPLDGAEQLAEREAEEEVSEPSYRQCRVHHPLHTDWLCTKPFGHEDKHGYAGCFWTESPLTDDELVGVRGLLQERYEPESVADYMARAERVEGGYIIHDTPEQAARMNDLAAATYSSATPPADDPAGVEHPPVPPAGIPATADTIAAILEVEFWCKRIEDADQIGRIAADALLKNFNITHKEGTQ